MLQIRKVWKISQTEIEVHGAYTDQYSDVEKRENDDQTKKVKLQTNTLAKTLEKLSSLHLNISESFEPFRKMLNSSQWINIYKVRLIKYLHCLRY